MNISRAAVRKFVENHVRRQITAEGEGRFYAVQNDINDELSDAIAHVKRRAGDVAAERFGRLYAEEQLALERDGRANPQAMRARIMGQDVPQRQDYAEVPKAMLLPAPSRPFGGFWLLCMVFGAALVLLL